jgi:hypothetical protein
MEVSSFYEKHHHSPIPVFRLKQDNMKITSYKRWIVGSSPYKDKRYPHLLFKGTELVHTHANGGLSPSFAIVYNGKILKDRWFAVPIKDIEFVRYEVFKK